jgi:uncharacterized protein
MCRMFCRRLTPPVVVCHTARMSTKDEILTSLRKNGEKLRSLGVRRIGLFGSFARNEAGPESDIDLLVEFVPNEKTFDNFMALSFFLEELFGRRVELVTIESLSPYMGPHIMKEVEYVSLAA